MLQKYPTIFLLGPNHGRLVPCVPNSSPSWRCGFTSNLGEPNHMWLLGSPSTVLDRTLGDSSWEHMRSFSTTSLRPPPMRDLSISSCSIVPGRTFRHLGFRTVCPPNFGLASGDMIYRVNVFLYRPLCLSPWFLSWIDLHSADMLTPIIHAQAGEICPELWRPGKRLREC